MEKEVKGERERLKKVEDAVLDSGGELAPVAVRLVEVKAERDVARNGEAHWKMRLYRHLAGRVAVEKEMKRLLQEGFNLQVEIDHLNRGKVAPGKDKEVRPTLFGSAPIDRYSEGMQTVGPEVSTVVCKLMCLVYRWSARLRMRRWRLRLVLRGRWVTKMWMWEWGGWRVVPRSLPWPRLYH